VTSGKLCTFAEDSNFVYIANGGNIAKVDVSAKTLTLITGPTSPTKVTHVAFIQGYLVANGASGVAGDTFFTGPSTIADYLTSWEVYNNEALPDGNLAVMEDGQFIYNFGNKSVEMSVNDGVTPWAKYASGFVPYGIHAPNSVVKADHTFYWLGSADNALRVLKMTGGAAQEVSTPYDSIINSLVKTDDAYAYLCGTDGHTFYTLQFPTEGLTFVYHIQNDCWYQWAYYNTTTARYESFLGRCNAYNSNLSKNIMGIRNAGTIATFEGFTDLGALIRSELTSGNVSGGTYVRKKSARMRFQLQRGLTTSATAEPTFQWQCRDDGGLWQPLRSLSLGKIGQSDYIAQMERCGIGSTG
jgi:hypothetical protein